MNSKQEIREEVIVCARSWIGTPYRHNACLKLFGADCLGLLRGIYQEIYGDAPSPPPYTPDWGETPGSDGKFPELLLDAARFYLEPCALADRAPGDVILFRVFAHGPIKHCAILSEPERMIHAYSGHDVCESYIGRGWERRITHAFCFPQKEEQ